MTLELDTRTISDAIIAYVQAHGFPVDADQPVVYTVYDGDGEALEVQILTARLAIRQQATGNGQQ